MIPFNHLGFVFKKFGKLVYPNAVKAELCTLLKLIKTNAKVLDIGAGTGMMCEFAYACRQDLGFTAVDPAEGMLKFSPKYVTTHKATAEALPFKDNSFDVALMGESLHHLEDVDKSLAETVRVLKDGAVLFIYDFNKSKFIGKSIWKVEKLLGEPGNFFVPSELEEKLSEIGFSVSIQQYGWRYTITATLDKK
jgi:ubiquinone/menaquinone biosynthesis C-methylase UbiE